MKAEDLVIGGKYVPHKKTIGVSFESCGSWNDAKDSQQPFLFYIGKNEFGYHCFSISMGYGGIIGYYFNPEDVMPYVEAKEESFEDAKERMSYQAADWEDFENKTGAYSEHKEEVKEDSTTIEQAAKNYAEKFKHIVEHKSWSQAKIDDFSAGANWQKKQTQALKKSHDELLEALEAMTMQFRNWEQQDAETNGYRWATKAKNAIENAKKIKK